MLVRFKTREELGYGPNERPSGFNSEGKMDYLFGSVQELICNYGIPRVDAKGTRGDGLNEFWFIHDRAIYVEITSNWRKI